MSQENTRQLIEESFKNFLQVENDLPAPKTFAELKNSKSRKLMSIVNGYGKAATIKTVATALTKICKYINCEIAPEMITRAAEVIVDKYPLCTMADLKMFESWIFTATGERYFKLDTIELCRMFVKYIESKEEAIEQINIAEQKATLAQAEIDTEEDYQFFLKKYENKLWADYQRSDRVMTFEEFCRDKYKPIDNPNPKVSPTVNLSASRKIVELSVRELAARHGKDYDQLLKKQDKYWKKQYYGSEIQNEISYNDFARTQKTRFDNNLRNELNAS